MIQWPWKDEATGSTIHQNLFYGFSDSGSTYTVDQPTLLHAMRDITDKYTDVKPEDMSFKPEELGECSPVVITGIEYVTELLKREIIDENGKWL